MEVTSQPTQAQASAPSAMPTNAAQPSAYQSATSQPSISPEYQAQAPGPAAAPGLPSGSGPAGFGTPGQSMAGGVPGAQRKLEYKQPLPSPGSVLGLPDANTAGPQQASWASQAQQCRCLRRSRLTVPKL